MSCSRCMIQYAVESRLSDLKRIRGRSDNRMCNEKTAVNNNSFYNSIYDIINLRRRQYTASNENILQTEIVFNVI
jgi:hypothetical protein